MKPSLLHPLHSKSISAAFSLFAACFMGFGQVNDTWIFTTLSKHAPSAYYIIHQFQRNGSSISYGGSSQSSTMHHLEFCDKSSVGSFLSSISTTVHETAHALDGQIPYMLAKEGKFDLDGLDHEGFVFDEHNKMAFGFTKKDLFESRELSTTIPKNLRTFRYDTYIESESKYQSTQSNGVVGLLDEFNAYYHGSKVIFDLLPVYKEEYEKQFLWHWAWQFNSNAEAFYEFDFWIKEYLLYAKDNKPELYEELKNDDQFRYIYQSIRSRFVALIQDYEKIFDQSTLLAQKSKEYILSVDKHTSTIYPTLAPLIESKRFDEIKRDFLNH